MRLYAAYIFLTLMACFAGLAYGNAEEQGRAEARKDTPALSSIEVCIWVDEKEGETESRYVANLGSKKLESETSRSFAHDQVSDCSPKEKSPKGQNADAYASIINRIKIQQEPHQRDQRLAEAIQWIQESASWGESPAKSVVSSPDGTHVVLKPRWKSLLLVNVTTLETSILAKAHGYLDTPVAWSPDSRFVALATPDANSLQIVSVNSGNVVSNISGTGSSVRTLAWSPDAQYIASVEWRNRRMNKTPFGLIGAFAGHPEFRNDGFLSIYEISTSQHISYALKRGISEMRSSNAVIQWK